MSASTDLPRATSVLCDRLADADEAALISFQAETLRYREAVARIEYHSGLFPIPHYDLTDITAVLDDVLAVKPDDYWCRVRALNRERAEAGEIGL